MQKLQALKNKKGFTLVELIVVIVIIAVLAAVAVPMMMKYVGDAKESAKQAAIDVISTAAAAASAAVESNVGSAKGRTFVEELASLLPGEKYSIGTITSNTSLTITLKGTGTDASDTGAKTIVITGTLPGTSGSKNVITKVEAGTTGW